MPISVFGWSAPENDIVWTYGRIAGLYLHVKDPKLPARISIRCRPFILYHHVTAQSFKVIDKNGNVLFDGMLTEEKIISFKVPPESFIGETIPLLFEFSNALCPDSLDAPVGKEATAIGFEWLAIGS